MARQALVVSTAHRGVFFGYGDSSEAANAGVIRLEQARMCLYWAAQTKGFSGLAATGPLGASRVGPPAPAITLRDVTAVLECSEEAAAQWESGPWAT